MIHLRCSHCLVYIHPGPRGKGKRGKGRGEKKKEEDDDDDDGGKFLDETVTDGTSIFVL